MAGERNSEPTPWERAARKGNDEGWYGGRDTGDRYPDYPEFDEQPAPYSAAVPEPRRPRAAAWDEEEVAGTRAAIPRSRGGDKTGGGGGGRNGGRGEADGGSRFGPKAVVLLSTASLLGTVGGAAAFTYEHFNGNINTFSDAGLSKNRPAAAKANAEGQTPENILLVGSDSRDNGNNAFGGGATGAGARSDTSILLHVYADHKHAVGISIPRDMMVNIPSCLVNPNDPNGKTTAPQLNQFNAAFAVGDTSQGNVACEINTIEQLSGIRVDHTVVVGFAAFAKLTSDIGGVQVCVPKDVSNVNGDNITLHKGIQLVSGQVALDYVREREGLGDGSDIGRTRRQQAFLGSMIKKIESDGVLNSPSSLTALLNDAMKYAVFDPGLGNLSALTSFAESIKGVNPANIQFMTLPGHYDGARVAIDPTSAAVIWDHLKNDQLLDGSNATITSGAPTPAAPSTTAPAAPPAPSIPPATISVKVQNGTTATGLAGDATTSLQAQGYNAVLSRTNPGNFATTTIIYEPSKEAEAKQLATLYPGAILKSTGYTSQIVVDLGADYAAAQGKSTSTGGGTTSSSSSSAA